ncbi:GTP 3',8-cyclase, mitochondrial [Phlyctochytrium bullatum]|nr:GTP 3',8-cyclase, mitochondrial [Phlyctochytrium bullatum]
MTTNGLVVGKQLPELRKAGLDSINISLDTLDPLQFELVTRRRGHDRVMSSIKASLECGFKSVKVNTVVMKGFNEHEIVDFIETFTRDDSIYMRFIEYMPFDGKSVADVR